MLKSRSVLNYTHYKFVSHHTFENWGRGDIFSTNNSCAPLGYDVLYCHLAWKALARIKIASFNTVCFFCCHGYVFDPEGKQVSNPRSGELLPESVSRGSVVCGRRQGAWDLRAHMSEPFIYFLVFRV